MKTMIKQQLGIVPWHLNWEALGKVMPHTCAIPMDDGHSLSDYNIQNDDVLNYNCYTFYQAAV